MKIVEKNSDKFLKSGELLSGKYYVTQTVNPAVFTRVSNTEFPFIKLGETGIVMFRKESLRDLRFTEVEVELHIL